MQVGATIAQPAQGLVSGITLWAPKPGDIVPTQMLIGPYRVPFRLIDKIGRVEIAAAEVLQHLHRGAETRSEATLPTAESGPFPE
jgi:hypothetical protein